MIHVRAGDKCGYSSTNSTVFWECSSFKSFTMLKRPETCVPTVFCRYKNQLNPFTVETSFPKNSRRGSTGLNGHR